MADRERHNPYVRAQPRSWDAAGVPSSDTTGSYELICPACGDEVGRTSGSRPSCRRFAGPTRASGRPDERCASTRAWPRRSHPARSPVRDGYEVALGAAHVDLARPGDLLLLVEQALLP